MEAVVIYIYIYIYIYKHIMTVRGLKGHVRSESGVMCGVRVGLYGE